MIIQSFVHEAKTLPTLLEPGPTYLSLVSGPAIPDDELSVERSGDEVSAIAGKVTARHLVLKK